MKPKQLYYGLLATLALLSLVAIGGFVLGHRLLNSKISQLQRTSADIQLETENIQRLRQLEADYKKIAPLATKAQSILPSQKQQAEIVAQIATIVSGNGVPLTGLSFETTQGLPNERSQTLPAKVPGILVMPVKFESSGTYAQLQSLLKNFESQQRYMQVSALDINRADNNNVSFNITLEVFLKP